MSGKDSDNRFNVIYKEAKMMSGVKIIEDQVTGIQYLFSWDGYAGGITPLLDKDGKPVINKKDE
ncbi:DUF6440 family protein [Gottfriedia acidiceleris]|uniref:DUF6440 family protein n=1 Tax=Gottfriedia acidiceleris TaxID=371036 RepID=UPI00101BE5E6|nr:DUF6440 family protein [Gottfriedia acidiceleris]